MNKRTRKRRKKYVREKTFLQTWQGSMHPFIMVIFLQ